MPNRIYLAPINHHNPPCWKNIRYDLRQCLPFEFNFLKLNLDLKLFFSEERNQYHSTFILSKLLDCLPEDGSKIVGITQVDIFTPILTFLFGEAQLNGKGALVSTYRLRNEYYGLPANQNLLYDRLLKEIVHELGHTLGLVHCRNYECVMNSSTYVEDIDLKTSRLCKLCENKLKTASI